MLWACGVCDVCGQTSQTTTENIHFADAYVNHRVLFSTALARRSMAANDELPIQYGGTDLSTHRTCGRIESKGLGNTSKRAVSPTPERSAKRQRGTPLRLELGTDLCWLYRLYLYAVL